MTHNSIEHLLTLSKTEIRNKNFEKALKYSEDAVRLSNGTSESQLRRLVCLFRLKRAGEAKTIAKYIGDGKEQDVWRQILADKSILAVNIPRIPPLHQQDPPALQGIPPRVGWYQTARNITIVVYRKDLPDTTIVVIDSDALKIESPQFQWYTNLASTIDVKNSSFNINKFNIEFNLTKLEPSTWSSYNGQSKAVVTTSKPKNTSEISYSKWDNVEDSDDENDSSDPLQFFQKLYKDATPEVQKAMAKSYVESNGTAISTNWEEVSKAKVEVYPPSN